MESYCVIGGEGFVGKALVAALLVRYPTCTVNSLGLTQRTFLPAPYAFLRTDITDFESLRAAFERCCPTVVFHTASPHPGSSKEVCETVNVAGTAAVLEACRAEAARAGAPVRVVFTSSVTVVYEGVDLINVDERLPRTLSELDSYVATKAKAEELVLEANGKDGLLTCSLRLAGIFGPGDRQVLPGLINVLKSHQTSFQIGSNTTLFDFVHIDNVVHAHLLAAAKLADEADVAGVEQRLEDRLDSVNLTIPKRMLPTSRQTDVALLTTTSERDAPLPALRVRWDQFNDRVLHAPAAVEDHMPTLSLAGSALFITNGEPVPFWTFCRAVWFAYDGHIPPFTVALPKTVALVLALASETIADGMTWLGMGGKGGKVKAAITTTEVRYVTGGMWFNIERARVVLGYEPVIGLEEGIKSAVTWYRDDEAAQPRAG